MANRSLRESEIIVVKGAFMLAMIFDSLRFVLNPDSLRSAQKSGLFDENIYDLLVWDTENLLNDSRYYPATDPAAPVNTFVFSYAGEREDGI